MRIFSFLTKHYLILSLIILHNVQCQLYIPQECSHLPDGAGVMDARHIIDQEIVPLVLEIAKYARNRIARAVYYPQELSGRNRRRVTNILRSLGLRTSHPDFHDFLDGLLSTSRSDAYVNVFNDLICGLS